MITSSPAVFGIIFCVAGLAAICLYALASTYGRQLWDRFIVNPWRDWCAKIEQDQAERRAWEEKFKWAKTVRWRL